MFNIGTVKGFEIVPNRDGVGNRLMLQVEMTNQNDIQSVELRNPAGEDNNPVNGSQVIIFDGGQAFKVAIGVQDNIEPSVNPGEKLLYSLNSGAIAAFIKLLSSGIIELNGNANFAVRFNELKTGFDQLKTDLNNFIVTYNTHNHPTAPVGPVSGPSATESASTANIDSSKIDVIKVP